MSRREVSHRDRDRGDRDRDDYPSKRQAAPRESTSSRPKLDEFWLDGEGIDRQVLQSSICRFLGSEATSRPFELNGKPGYKIRAIRPFTPDMLDDLRSLSQAFVQENKALARHNREEVRYENSQTRIRQDLPEYEQYDNQSRYAGQGSGAYSSVPNSYPSDQAMGGYATMYTSGSYQPGPPYTMAPPSGIPAYNDPGRYQAEYQGYPSGHGREVPPSGYGAYSNPNNFADAGRRPDMSTGGYYAGGPSIPRLEPDPRDPRYSGYEMPGIQATGGPYPQVRGPNPSQYDAVPRYDNRPPAAEPYVSSRRR